MFKNALAVMLAVVMVFGGAPLGVLMGLRDWLGGLNIAASAAHTWTVGDIGTFGSYPQTEVTDATLLAALNAQTLTWVSYGYYSGTGSYGTMTQSDYMKYADVIYDGSKYRAVNFTSYRPSYTIYSSSNSFQDENGYSTNTTYWFKYEPLHWRVLDLSTGLVMCESIIDSQAYSDLLYWKDIDSDGSSFDYETEFFNNSACTVYSNDYVSSSIRTWLNGGFFQTAFTSSEQSVITTTTLDNSACPGYSQYNSASTNDKLFLLSYSDSINTAYGFSSSMLTNDTARYAQGSDYAKCQGLWVHSSEGVYYGNSTWRLRSPGLNSAHACNVYLNGFAYDLNQCSVYYTNLGVRPAFKISNLSSLIFTSSEAVPVTGVSLSAESFSLVAGESASPAATVEPANVTNKSVTWSSSNEDVATVDSTGLVTAKSAGTATITVTANDTTNGTITDTCTVTVSDYQISFTCTEGTKCACEYSDGYFSNAANQYNHDLATASLCFALSAFVTGGGDYSSKEATNAKNTLADIGFNTDYEHYSEFGYDSQPKADSIAGVIGYKNTTINGSPTTVIALAVRGGGYEAEWAGNFTVGYGTNHLGFDTAKSKVLSKLESFVYNRKGSFNSKVVIWLTGYSRAAATANLIAAALNDGADSYSNLSALGLTKNSVYAYTFETPLNTTDNAAKSSRYNNIFNIVNPIDPVARVAPAEWGYTRYGITCYLPSAETTVNYGKLKKKLAVQYKAITGETYSEDFMFYEMNIPHYLLYCDELFLESKGMGQGVFLDNLIRILSKEIIKGRDNYVSKYQSGVRTLVESIELGEKADTFLPTFKTHFFSSLADIFWGRKSIADIIAQTASETTKLTYGEALNLTDGLNEALHGAVDHPNYTYSVIKSSEALGFGHFPSVCLAWMKTISGEFVDTSVICPDVWYLNKKSYRVFKANCPVDVSVYDDSGNLVASIISDVPADIENSSIASYVDENGQKCFCLPDDGEFSVQMTATDDGEVTCSVSEFDREQEKDVKVVNYYEMDVKDGDVLNCSAENLDEVENCSYEITSPDITVPEPEVMTGDEIVSCAVTVDSKAEGESVVTGGGTFTKGEFAKVSAFPDETQNFVGWFVNGELVSDKNEYRFSVRSDVKITAEFTAPVSGVGFSAPQESVVVGKTKQLVANITPSYATETGIEWSSSNENVATIDNNGLLTAIKTGKTIITVSTTYGGFTDTCEVTVYNNVESITVASMPSKIQYNYKQALDITGLTLTATYSDNSTRTITDTSQMTVTGYNAKKTGTQTLAVEYEGCSTSINVTVKMAWWQWLIKILLFGWIWY